MSHGRQAFGMTKKKSSDFHHNKKKKKEEPYKSLDQGGTAKHVRVAKLAGEE